jgi:hypothetical protein
LRMLTGIRRKRQAWEQERCPKLCGLFHFFLEVAKGVHGCNCIGSTGALPCDPCRLLATTVASSCEETAGHVGSGLVKESLSDEESIDAQAQNHQYL